jgi:ATP-binding cassette subfamily B protein
MATMMAYAAPRAAVCADRIYGGAETPSRPWCLTADPVTQLPESGTVRFDDVQFSYPGADSPVLTGINFEMRPGQTTAVVGSTGSGKTTLVSLIPRLFDVTGGECWSTASTCATSFPMSCGHGSDSCPRSPTCSAARSRPTFVTDARMRLTSRSGRRSDTAQASDFVERNGFDDRCADCPGRAPTSPAASASGCRLHAPWSSVQRSTSSTTRSARWMSPPMHDCAQPCGPDQDAAVLSSRSGSSTVRQADQIIVLDEGTIVGVGTHTELLDSCQTYREIVESQLSIEEAA